VTDPEPPGSITTVYLQFNNTSFQFQTRSVQEPTVNCSIQNNWSLEKKMLLTIMPEDITPLEKKLSTWSWIESGNWLVL